MAPWARAECLAAKVQRDYVADGRLRSDLERLGSDFLDDGAIADIQAFSDFGFALEFQFDVGVDGRVLSVLSVSVRCTERDWMDPKRRGRLGDLASCLLERGYVDERIWKLPDTLGAKGLKRGDESLTLGAFPAFVKLRWREWVAPDAKTYLVAMAM